MSANYLITAHLRCTRRAPAGGERPRPESSQRRDVTTKCKSPNRGLAHSWRPFSFKKQGILNVIECLDTLSLLGLSPPHEPLLSLQLTVCSFLRALQGAGQPPVGGEVPVSGRLPASLGALNVLAPDGKGGFVSFSLCHVHGED